MAKNNTSIAVWLWRMIGFIMIIPSVFWLYQYFFVERPQTVGTTVVSSLNASDEAVEDAQTFLNVNYWKNSDGTAKELLEVAFTSYAGQNTDRTITQGLQCYDGVERNQYYHEQYSTSAFNYTGFYRTERNYYFSNTVKNLCYFDITEIDNEHSTAMISMSPAKTLNTSNFILTTHQIETDSENNSVDRYTPVSLQFKKLNSNLLFKEQHRWNLISMAYEKYYYYAGVDEFMISIENSVKSLDAGTHYIYIDLSDWFDVFLYDSTRQDYTRQTADQQYTYVLMKVTVQNQGVTRDSQSMFGKIAKEDGSFDFSHSDSTPFWKYENNYTITASDFETIDYQDGKMLVLKRDLVDYLQGFRNVKVSIELDLDELDNVIAVNTLSLGNLSYKNITITGTEPRTLTFKYAYNLAADNVTATSGITVVLENSDIVVGVA